MRRINLLFAMFGVFLFMTMMTACATPGDDYGVEKANAVSDAKVAVAALSAADIGCVKVVVNSGSEDVNQDGFPVGPVTLVKEDTTGVYSTEPPIDKIPVGDAREFVATAYDIDDTAPNGCGGKVLYSGIALADVVEGSTVSVNIFLTQDSPPDDFGNHAPVISSIVFSDGHIAPTVDTLNIAVTATDADSDVLTYEFTFDDGSGEGGTLADDPADPDSTADPYNFIELQKWSSNVPGTYSLELKVTDSKGVSTSVSVSPAVVVYALSSADVTIDVTSAPVFVSLHVGYPGYVHTGYSLSLTVKVDPTDDNENIYYDWYVEGCTGNFSVDEPTVATTDLTSTTGFTLIADNGTAEEPADGWCTVGVEVTVSDPDDASGAAEDSAKAYLVLPIGPPSYSVSWNADEPEEL